MNDPHPTSPRTRLQELLAVPDRQRTDEQWDEINELEILLAPGNRERGPEQNSGRKPNPPVIHSKPGGGVPHGKKQGRKFHKRPPKGKAP
jgi:hypothetical protein